MWFAQTPVPTVIPGVQFETVATAPVMGPMQMVVLSVYFLVCLSLVVCVTMNTSKSEGLMQQSLSAAPNSGGGGKGKMTPEERLAGITTRLAYTFLFMSILVAYTIKI